MIGTESLKLQIIGQRVNGLSFSWYERWKLTIAAALHCLSNPWNVPRIKKLKKIWMLAGAEKRTPAALSLPWCPI